MTNPWIEHLRQYAFKNKMTYAQALKDPKAQALYKKSTMGGAQDNPQEIDSPTTAGYRRQIGQLEAKIAKRALQRQVESLRYYLMDNIEVLRASKIISNAESMNFKQEVNTLYENMNISNQDVLPQLQAIERRLEPFLDEKRKTYWKTKHQPSI
jgi:adenylosuccinate synthase